MVETDQIELTPCGRRVLALAADNAALSALLRRMLARYGNRRCATPLHDPEWCVEHGCKLPCPVGEARALLEREGN